MVQLGELAKNEAAFAARGVQVLAVSVDSIDTSSAMAARLGIRFPLIQDESLALARNFVGIDTNDLPLPGVVLLRRGGALVFRHVGTSKDDRIATDELLRAVDQHLLDAPAPPIAVASYSPLLRWQVGARLGVLRGARQTVGLMDVSLGVPYGRHVLVGPMAQVVGTHSRIDAAGLGGQLTLRLPFWYDVFAAQASGAVLWVAYPSDSASPVAWRLMAELWFSAKPYLGVTLGAAITRFDGHTSAGGHLGLVWQW